LKHALLIIGLFVFVSSYGQVTLSLSPNPSSVSVKSTDLDIAAKASLTNKSKDTLILKWTRKIETLTQGWSSAVCDKNFCYIPTVDTMRLIMAPDEVSNMDIHIYPMGITGTAKITLKVEQVGNPENSVSGTYLFNGSTPTRGEGEKEIIQIYPNPAVEFFIVNSPVVLGKIELYNITGDKAKIFYAYKNKRYYIDDIPSGIYLVRLLNLQEEIVKTLVLKKK
jgi:hypothetical protein